MRCVIAVLLSMSLLGCVGMSGKERSKREKQLIKATAKQARTYQPIVFKGVTTITAADGIVINVPLEQLRFKEIPNDFKTGADLVKWLSAAGLTGYAIHSVAGDSSVINNNNAGGAE